MGNTDRLGDGEARLTHEQQPVHLAFMALMSLSIARFRGHVTPQYSLTEKIGVSDAEGVFPPLNTSSLSPRQIVVPFVFFVLFMHNDYDIGIGCIANYYQSSLG